MQVLQKHGKYENAKVFIRVMPLEKIRWDYFKILNDNKTIYVRTLQDFEKGYENRVPHYWNFRTDGVLYNLNQKDVYKTIISDDFINEVLEGQDAIVLAYGQTGSGKSLTINGMHCQYEERGIAPRFISRLFGIKNDGAMRKMDIVMSYIETRKSYAVDLLRGDDNLLDANSIKNVTSMKVDNERDALEALFRAEGRRDVSDSNRYASNNANGVLTFEISTYNGLKGCRKSKIHLVDLAGVDNLGNITCFFKNITDVGQANLAKTQLEQFLLILCQNIYDRIVVKQRLNILIAYLKDALNTKSLLRFVGHVRTDFDNLKLTLSILRFSQIVLGLKFAKSFPESDRVEAKMPELVRTELDRVKTERMLEQMFNGTDTDLSTNVDQGRANHIKNLINEFISDKINAIVPLNFAEVSVVLEVFKDQFIKLKKEKEDAYQTAYNAALAEFSKERSKSDRQRVPSLTKRVRSKTNVSSQSKIKNGESIVQLIPAEKEYHSVTSCKKHSSVKSMRRYSSGKRRSLTSEILGGETSSQDQLDVNALGPMPTYEDAWVLFSVNVNYDYEKLMESIKRLENEIINVHKDYMSEVNNLNIINDVLLIRKNELHQIEFKKDLCGTIDSGLEKDCRKRLGIASDLVIKQQEEVLKWQAELRIVINSLQETKKELHKEFDRFCMDKYKTRIPKIEVNPIEIVSSIKNELEREQIKSSEKDRMPAICEDKISEMKAYAELQSLMYKEASVKKTRYKHQKWTNIIKIR